MNIFVLDEDPRQAARYLCDSHCVKMVLESAQLMAAVANIPEIARPDSVARHPCALWAGATRSNYDWLYEHWDENLREYTRRYRKSHFYERYRPLIWEGRFRIPDGPMTPHAQAMPWWIRCEGDAVTAYRIYYAVEKARLARWRHGETPAWFEEMTRD